VKKLLSLLIALAVLAGSTAIIGCGDDKGKDKDKAAKDKDKDKDKAKDKDK
jgi:Ni/Co efflux regulator RcnB